MNTGDEFPEISPADLRQRLDAGERIAIIDVREPFEWEIVNLADRGARLIPLGEVADRLGEIDSADQIVVVCRTGARSASVARHLLANGYDRVLNLRGGIKAWAAEVDPSLPTY